MDDRHRQGVVRVARTSVPEVRGSDGVVRHPVPYALALRKTKEPQTKSGVCATGLSKLLVMADFFFPPPPAIARHPAYTFQAPGGRRVGWHDSCALHPGSPGDWQRPSDRRTH